MLRMSLALLGTGILAISSGCSLCCAPFDSAFGAYGGVIEREDIYQGRVGSVFEPAGAQVVSYDQMEEETVIEPDSAFEPMEIEPINELPSDGAPMVEQ